MGGDQISKSMVAYGAQGVEFYPKGSGVPLKDLKVKIDKVRLASERGYTSYNMQEGLEMGMAATKSPARKLLL